MPSPKPSGRGVLVWLAAVWLLGAAGGAAREQPPRAPAVPTVLEVPFVAQTANRCAGASAAMVMRYWGDAVDARAFDDLLGDDGVSARALVDDLRARGYRAWSLAAERGMLRHHIGLGRPVLGLLEVGPALYHWVVFVADEAGLTLYHDPAVGPFRVVDDAELERLWAPTGHLAILVLPSPALEAARGEGARSQTDREMSRHEDPLCGQMLSAAANVAAADRLDAAAELFERASLACRRPERPLVALAGVRFREKRYREAADLAGRAVELGATGRHVWHLIGASRHLVHDSVGALEAWERLREPRLDLLDVSPDETHAAVLAEYLDLTPGAPLTAETFVRARRRLADLPSVKSSRLGLRPLGKGRASLDAVVAEYDVCPSPLSFAVRAALDGALSQQTRLRLVSPTGSGAVVALAWTWQAARRSLTLEAAAPDVAGIPGITRLGVTRERSFHGDDTGTLPRTTERVGLLLSNADWRSASTWVRSAVGFDRWRASGAFARLGLGLERRLLADRLALRASGELWLPLDGASAISRWRLGAGAQIGREPRPWRVSARLSLAGVSDGAPIDLWPRAGNGDPEAGLLRARTLVADGHVRERFLSRTLALAGVEIERRLRDVGPVTVSLAAFADAAAVRRDRRPGEGPGTAVDLGAGLRLRLPGSDQAVRLDVGVPLGGSGVRWSAGWLAEY